MTWTAVGALLGHQLPGLAALGLDFAMIATFAAMVTVPAELHPTLKALAARTKAGEPVDAVLAELFPTPNISCPRVADERPSTVFSWLNALPAWCRLLLRWLLPGDATKPH